MSAYVKCFDVRTNWFLKTKIKFYADDATDFHDKEMTKAGSDFI